MSFQTFSYLGQRLRRSRDLRRRQGDQRAGQAVLLPAWLLRAGLQQPLTRPQEEGRQHRPVHFKVGRKYKVFLRLWYLVETPRIN